jgi:hypothetical protein
LQSPPIQCCRSRPISLRPMLLHVFQRKFNPPVCTVTGGQSGTDTAKSAGNCPGFKAMRHSLDEGNALVPGTVYSPTSPTRQFHVKCCWPPPDSTLPRVLPAGYQNKAKLSTSRKTRAGPTPPGGRVSTASRGLSPAGQT